MFRKPLIALAATVSLFALPAAAQETPASAAAGEAAMAAMAGAFKVDPLTAEQQARLPLAQTIVGKIMPPGTMNEVMGAMSQSILGPLAALASTPTPGDAVRMLGADPDSVVLDDVTAKEVIGIIDPAWKDRREQSVAVTQETMTKVMGAMEPVIRKAMAEIYAVHFSTPELTDIDSFFSTPSGKTYARKSFMMSSDPRIVAASFEAMPQMMESFQAMEGRIAAATAALPAERTFDQLSAADRKRLADLTGLDQQTIREGMEAAHDTRDGAGHEAAD